jgi:hypothetical protein
VFALYFAGVLAFFEEERNSGIATLIQTSRGRGYDYTNNCKAEVLTNMNRNLLNYSITLLSTLLYTMNSTTL